MKRSGLVGAIIALLFLWSLLIEYSLSYANVAKVNVASATNASGSDVTINKPTSTVDGNVMVAAIATIKNITVTAPVSGGTWNIVTGSPFAAAGNAYRVHLFWKVAASEPSSYKFTCSAQCFPSGGIESLSGADTFNPIAVIGTKTTNSCTTLNFASITLPNTPEWHIATGATNNGSANSTPTGFASEWNIGGTGGSNIVGNFWYDKSQSTTPTGTITSGCSGTDNNVGIDLAIQVPQPTATATTTATPTTTATRTATPTPTTTATTTTPTATPTSTIRHMRVFGQ